MEPNEKSTGGCCVGPTASAAVRICVDERCNHHPLVCDNQECSCRAAHKGHDVRDLSTYQTKLTHKAQILHTYIVACEAISRLVRMGIYQFQDIRHQHEIHRDGRLALLKKMEGVVERLLGNGAVETPVTGKTIHSIIQNSDRAKATLNKLRDWEMLIMSTGSLSQMVTT